MAQLASLVYLVVVAVALLYARGRGVQGLLMGTVFLTPWFGLMKDFGLTLNADRILAVFLVVTLAIQYGPRALSLFSGFMLYATVVTIALSISLPESAASFASTKGQWRWLFQLPIWVMLMAPGAALVHLGTRDSVTSVLRALVLSGTILGAMGIVQYVTYYATGVDLFPLGLFYDLEGAHGAFQVEGFMGGSVFRASALAGEPKHLAYTLATCLTVLAADRTLGGLLGISRKAFSVSATICLVGLVLSYSTQGFALLAVNAAILVAATAILRGMSKRMAVLVATIPALLIVLSVIPGLSDVVYDRSLGRLLDSGFLEDWNEAVWDWYRESPFAWPFGVGLGNVHLYALTHIPAKYLFFMKGNVFVAKSGLLRIASELGLVGLGVFGATILQPMTRVWRAARRRSALASSASVCVTAGIVDYFLSNDGPTYVFLFVGLAASVAKVTSSGTVTQTSHATTPLHAAAN